ncbi:MAG: hypothetical protein V3U84_02680 [Thiotrichaceae bacterium]
MKVYFESPFSPAEKNKLLKWLQVASDTITTLYGEFPVTPVETHLYALQGANEPVPWGEVWKKGSYRVNFQVNPAFPIDKFIADWTAVHEFSHLFHPYPGSGNAWFGEGLASYYQNVLRVRNQTLSESQAWGKLLAGFQRGEKQSEKNNMTLLQASQKMHSIGNYQHVYWGGAAYFLAVDIRLRKLTKGQESLDTAWYQFKECCLSAKQNWSTESLIHKLDQLTGTSVFHQEYVQKLKSTHFPNYRNSFQELGIVIAGSKGGKGNSIQIIDKGASASLRAEIISAND